MRIKCKKSDLSEGISIVSKAVSNKTTMPILQCILIEATGGRIKLIANDLELGIETYIEGTVIEEGKIALEAKFFSDIVRKLPESDINIETNSDYKTTVYCEKTKAVVPCRSGEDFSYLPDIEKEKSIVISQMTLRDIIRQTIFSISDNENTRLMTGELFEVKNNKLSVVSLDGHRISIRNVELKGDNPDIKVVVPGKTLQEISKILSGGIDDEVSIFFSDNNILFEFDDTRIVSRLLEGEYFKISQMLSIDHKIVVRSDKRELMSVIDRASIFIQETDKKPIVVSVKNDNNMYIRVDTNLGSLNEELEIEKEGEEIIIGFNPKFLMDALRVIDDDKVSIYMYDSKSPCIIKNPEETYFYIILPININTSVY
ncbi:DNA polymerase III, beta subunit [Eubacterium ruminantium]|nr:DNA polymerase III, beta subunit [Eubacterium ruminantium]